MVHNCSFLFADTLGTIIEAIAFAELRALLGFINLISSPSDNRMVSREYSFVRLFLDRLPDGDSEYSALYFFFFFAFLLPTMFRGDDCLGRFGGFGKIGLAGCDTFADNSFNLFDCITLCKILGMTYLVEAPWDVDGCTSLILVGVDGSLARLVLLLYHCSTTLLIVLLFI